MLSLFDRAYRRSDPKMMHVSHLNTHISLPTDSTLYQHCAQTLLEFNGGTSCIQVYVNQHDFFINRAREVQVSKDDEM